jgi:hypothetical protein
MRPLIRKSLLIPVLALSGVAGCYGEPANGVSNTSTGVLSPSKSGYPTADPAKSIATGQPSGGSSIASPSGPGFDAPDLDTQESTPEVKNSTSQDADAASQATAPTPGDRSPDKAAPRE